MTFLALIFNLPSDKSRFGVLDAPSPKNPGLAGGGVWTLDDELDGFLDAIGADIDGLRFTKLNGRPSSESLSPVEPPVNGKFGKTNVL